MGSRGRNVFSIFLGVLLAAATVWALSVKPAPPADFTFVNETEIKSVDPALVTGQPESRVIMAISEGLVNWDPKTLDPIPGVADRWEISADKLTYTFHFRDNAKWTDGTRVTPQDFLWQWRRLLDPLTASEYSYQLWYIVNAQRYSMGPLNVGDRVEVELFARDNGALPFARGHVLHGKLVAVVEGKLLGDEKEAPIYAVDVGGKQHLFQAAAERDFEKWKPPVLPEEAAKKLKAELEKNLPKETQRAAKKREALSPIQPCQEVLLDFDEVGVKAIGDDKLQIKLNAPTPYFLQLMGFYILDPVNPRCVETYGYPNWTRPENIVTNGAFRLESRQVRQRIRLVKNEQYWNAAHVRLKTIDVLPVESLTTALNLYMTGAVDWITKEPVTVVPELLAQKRRDFNPQPGMIVYFYRLNCTKPPLDNKLVRKALAQALNRKEIVEGVTHGGEVPALSIVPPGLPGYEQPKGQPYNPEQARKLLAEAGYPGGRGLPKIELLYNSEEAHQLIAELVQAQWKENLGVNIGLQNMEWPSYLAAQQTMNYQISRAGWIGDYLDPNTFLDMWTTDNTNNQTGWSNKEYDKLIAEAAAERDEAKRMKLMQRAESILLDEMPIIPVYYYVTANMVRPYVKGFYNNLLDVHPLDAIWIDEAEKQKFLEAGGRG